MDVLKQVWPTAFKVQPKDARSLVVQLVLFVVVCAVVGLLISVLSLIPFVGILFGLLGGLVELYGFIGIVLSVLVFLEVI